MHHGPMSVRSDNSAVASALGRLAVDTKSRPLTLCYAHGKIVSITGAPTGPRPARATSVPGSRNLAETNRGFALHRSSFRAMHNS